MPTGGIVDLTVGDIENIKSAMERMKLSVRELLMLINNRLVCDYCEYKKEIIEMREKNNVPLPKA